MTGRAVIVGAGPIGLATAMLLAQDGYTVTVLEKDARPARRRLPRPGSAGSGGGVAQFRQAHFMHRSSATSWTPNSPGPGPDRGVGGGRFSLIAVLPPSLARAPPRGDERFETLTARRPPGVRLCAGRRAQPRREGPARSRRDRTRHRASGPPRDPACHRGAHQRRYGDRRRPRDRRHGQALQARRVGRRPRRPPAPRGGLDAGFAYCTRHFRSRDGSLPEFRGPLSTTLGTILVPDRAGRQRHLDRRHRCHGRGQAAEGAAAQRHLGAGRARHPPRRPLARRRTAMRRDPHGRCPGPAPPGNG